MRLTRLEVKNFRCFPSIAVDLDSQIVVIEGGNGTGKTTLLEAIHYLGNLRSFRTSHPKNMITFDQGAFFVKAAFTAQDTDHELQVGCSDAKRLVKLNQSPIKTFKDVFDNYRVLTITEDDLGLIRGSPEVRRNFVDQAIFYADYGFWECLKEYKYALDSRNALFQYSVVNREMFNLWTNQLIKKSLAIQERRKAMLSTLETKISYFISTYFDSSFSVKLTYKAISKPDEQQEFRAKRSLFGAHLDDFYITFQDKKSKDFSSRGQQKTVVFLLKLSQIQGTPVILIDDFLTDFDEGKVGVFIELLTSLNLQLIFTIATKASFFENTLLKFNPKKVTLGENV